MSVKLHKDYRELKPLVQKDKWVLVMEQERYWAIFRALGPVDRRYQDVLIDLKDYFGGEQRDMDERRSADDYVPVIRDWNIKAVFENREQAQQVAYTLKQLDEKYMADTAEARLVYGLGVLVAVEAT